MTPRGFARSEHSDRGFSAVELLVVVAFVMTLMLIALPALATLLRASEVRSAAVSIAQGMRTAQSLALSDQTGQTPHNYILVIQPDTNSTAPLFCWDHPSVTTLGNAGRLLWAVVEDVEGDCTIGATTATATDCDPATDVRLRGWAPEQADKIQFQFPGSLTPPPNDAIDIGGASGSATHKTICFTPRGYVSKTTSVGTGVYVAARFKELYQKVEVSLAGRTKVMRWNGTAYVD